jgi:hypothetical protein
MASLPLNDRKVKVIERVDMAMRATSSSEALVSTSWTAVAEVVDARVKPGHDG